MHEAKTNLSRLVKRAQAGEEIVIAISGKPAVRLVPVRESPRRPIFGTDTGKFSFADDWDTMTEEELDEWEAPL
jgi:prevent-host-death family protein